MCNSYEQHVAWQEYCRMMQELAWGLPTEQTERDLPQADTITIRDVGPVIRAADPLALGFPTADDGAAGLAFITAAIDSRANNGAWVNCG